VKLYTALTVMTLLLGLSHFYLARYAFRALQKFFPGISFAAVALVFLLLAAAMVLAFFRSMLPIPAGIKHLLPWIGFCWMGVFLYLLLFALVTDLPLLILSLLRGKLPSSYRQIGALVGLVCALGVSCWGFLHASQIRHVSYDIAAGQGEPLTIVLISDVHLGALGSETRLDKIVAEINTRKPDLVCIAGDFFDSDFAAIRDPEAAAEKLRQIQSTYGVYLSLGNHDAGTTFPQMLEFPESCGIRLLADQAVTIDNRLILAGRLDSGPIGGYGGLARQELASILPENSCCLPVVVLDHNPAHADSYDSRTDLVLCGHTHRGQLFPGELLTRRLFPVDYGYYRADGPHVVVTSGVGTWGMPMRVGTNCEIVTIYLHPEK